MRPIKFHNFAESFSFFQKVSIFMLLLLFACDSKKDPEPAKQIQYSMDGRTVKHGDPMPIVIDMNKDEMADFTIWVELVGNSSGDHLYAGVNPIGKNNIRSGPADDSRFLNSGMLIPVEANIIIDQALRVNEYWTNTHSILVIRNTPYEGPVWYEGAWANDVENIVAIRLNINEKWHYGWLRLMFDKTTEVVTLVDYAWEQLEERSLKAGEKE